MDVASGDTLLKLGVAAAELAAQIRRIGASKHRCIVCPRSGHMNALGLAKHTTPFQEHTIQFQRTTFQGKVGGLTQRMAITSRSWVINRVFTASMALCGTLRSWGPCPTRCGRGADLLQRNRPLLRFVEESFPEVLPENVSILTMITLSRCARR